MSFPKFQRRTLALLAVVVPLALLFLYVVLRSGPLAPVAVTVAQVQNRSVAPAVPGIGTVQARYTYRIGPTFAGRVKRVDVQVGDTVKAGQVLGEIDPVDLDERIQAQQAAIHSAEAALRQAQAKQQFAQAQASRYAQLLEARGTSEEITATKQQEWELAETALAASRQDVARLRAEAQALRAQRGSLRLLAPVAGLVTGREAEPGSTVVAGQAVIEVIDPGSLWINTRFDQISAQGLAADLPAQVVLRSRRGAALAGRVLRVEPRADAVTEETLAKIVFNAPPAVLPPLGELAEITVQLPELPQSLTLANAAIRTVDGVRGVWKLAGDGLEFVPVTLGRSDLEGLVQVHSGVAEGDKVVVYSEKALTTKSRIHVVERLAGRAP